MKVGILTFHDANNYGAILQAYALQETIRRLGYADVEIINYKQHVIVNQYKINRINFSSVNKFLRSIASTIIRFREFYCYKKMFDNFRNEHMIISKKTYDRPYEIEGYDIYITGSDQVWNSEATQYDSTFFLGFGEKEATRISYAASIGENSIMESEKAFIRENIVNLDYISVRENSAKEIIKNITDKDVYCVLDPTLLADKSIWDKFLSKSDNKEKYLLVYTVGPKEKINTIVEEVAKKLGIKVYYISWGRQTLSVNNKILKKVNPDEYISLFYNASFIVTNSFHGTAFSLIFNKNFITIPHKKTSTRMNELLDLLCLKDRVIEEVADLHDGIYQTIDYTNTNKILKVEKEKSMAFILNSLQQHRK